MVKGVKSKTFGPIWTSMFLTAMCYPEKITPECKDHIAKMKHYKSYYNSFQYIVPCKFCREFTKDVLMKDYPLDFSGRIPLMKSLYIWKDRVNRKLLDKKCPFTSPSPPFEIILKRYEKLRAKCDKKVGKCV